MFSSLVSKYGGDGASSEPNEQEFEAAQKKVESRRLAQKSKRKSWLSSGGFNLFMYKFCFYEHCFAIPCLELFKYDGRLYVSIAIFI